MKVAEDLHTPALDSLNMKEEEWRRHFLIWLSMLKNSGCFSVRGFKEI